MSELNNSQKITEQFACIHDIYREQAGGFSDKGVLTTQYEGLSIDWEKMENGLYWVRLLRTDSGKVVASKSCDPNQK